MLLGLTGVLAYNALFFWGLQLIPSGRAAVIVANNPVMIAIGAALVFNHRLSWIKSAGVLVSVTGAAIALAYFILGEPLTWSLAAGTVLVICGVYLTNNGLKPPWLRKSK